MNKSLLVFVVLLTTVTGCLAQPEATNPSLDTSLFLDGALAESITTEDCTLSGGTETTCYRITVTGTPTSHDVGPFCPQTITDTAEAG